jgi:ethanolamine utilization microcompartment shell protein EutS
VVAARAARQGGDIVSGQDDRVGIEDARRQVEQLRAALAHRTLIARAQGVLMERYGMSEAAAIGLLKRLSMETQVKVHDLAARVLDGATLGDLQQGVRRLER